MSRFTVINESFQCDKCGRTVPPRKVSCRNHCPYCLTSKHVDELPGDRNNSCQGMMTAIGYELSAKKGLVLRFRCQKCGFIGKNIAAVDDPDAPDNYDAILALQEI